MFRISLLHIIFILFATALTTRHIDRWLIEENANSETANFSRYLHDESEVLFNNKDELNRISKDLFRISNGDVSNIVLLDKDYKVVRKIHKLDPSATYVDIKCMHGYIRMYYSMLTNTGRHYCLISYILSFSSLTCIILYCFLYSCLNLSRLSQRRTIELWNNNIFTEVIRVPDNFGSMAYIWQTRIINIMRDGYRSILLKYSYILNTEFDLDSKKKVDDIISKGNIDYLSDQSLNIRYAWNPYVESFPIVLMYTLVILLMDNMANGINRLFSMPIVLLLTGCSYVYSGALYKFCSRRTLYIFSMVGLMLGYFVNYYMDNYIVSIAICSISYGLLLSVILSRPVSNNIFEVGMNIRSNIWKNTIYAVSIILPLFIEITNGKAFNIVIINVFIFLFLYSYIAILAHPAYSNDELKPSPVPVYCVINSASILTIIVVFCIISNLHDHRNDILNAVSLASVVSLFLLVPNIDRFKLFLLFFGILGIFIGIEEQLDILQDGQQLKLIFLSSLVWITGYMAVKNTKRKHIYKITVRGVLIASILVSLVYQAEHFLSINNMNGVSVILLSVYSIVLALQYNQPTIRYAIK